ncbi:hypothetical protein LCGC14_2161880, partial [marine sediment metagenome]
LNDLIQNFKDDKKYSDKNINVLLNLLGNFGHTSYYNRKSKANSSDIMIYSSFMDTINKIRENYKLKNKYAKLKFASNNYSQYFDNIIIDIKNDFICFLDKFDK